MQFDPFAPLGSGSGPPGGGGEPVDRSGHCPPGSGSGEAGCISRRRRGPHLPPGFHHLGEGANGRVVNDPIVHILGLGRVRQGCGHRVQRPIVAAHQQRGVGDDARPLAHQPIRPRTQQRQRFSAAGNCGDAVGIDHGHAQVAVEDHHLHLAESVDFGLGKEAFCRHVSGAARQVVADDDRPDT